LWGVFLGEESLGGVRATAAVDELGGEKVEGAGAGREGVVVAQEVGEGEDEAADGEGTERTLCLAFVFECVCV